MDKDEMINFYFEDPKSKALERQMGTNRLQYFYFYEDLNIFTKESEILNGCLLKGKCKLNYQNKVFSLNQFDFFFLPPNQNIKIQLNSETNEPYKICLYYSNIKGKVSAEFELQTFDLEKFIPRGDFSTEKRMTTYRTVWTAIRNGYFMSGFTNIPNKALKQGVVTSVNIESSYREEKEIYPHIHPEFPEVYIFCIDDDKYAITQYLIDEEGNSVCKDLTDGEGVFFPGNLGHMNFAKPFGKEIKYCMYLWFISTLGKVKTISPQTLRV
jgi:hypothetical protein